MYVFYFYFYESCNGVIYCYVGGLWVYKINCGVGYCYDIIKINCVKMDNVVYFNIVCFGCIVVIVGIIVDFVDLWFVYIVVYYIVIVFVRVGVKGICIFVIVVCF